ncbi:Histidine kinase [Chitinophaga sp. CF118]|uniref:sensor histidine kinase n=1 Tax=Chitinophaga sp. CF118 TaxID=1884367 RepID=UPI0008E5D1EE|nr:histidine kinase [Chitinophaga sp. CF118]SFD19936.1 Histidine kinase [Chitinophaga sp. CF118]
MNQFRKTELAAATGIYLLIIFMLVARSIGNNVFELQHEYGYKFEHYNQVFDYYKHYLLPLLAHITIIYAAFLFIHARIVPVYLERQRFFIGVLLLGGTIGIVFLTIMIAYTWYFGYLFGVYKTVRGVYSHCVKYAFIITTFYSTVYALYYAVRRLYFDFVHRNIITKPWFREIRTELVVILAMLVLLMICMAGEGKREMIVFFFIGIYYGFIYFICQYKTYPNYERHKNKRELARELVFISLTGFVLAIFIALVDRHLAQIIIPVMLAVYAIEIAVILPISWWIYRARHQRTIAFKGLQKALDHSEAGLDFLRWQINPHFLFNALNTLYGTALQEKAVATGEGIQKLGDMMRFMLHDNVLESIPLDKEIAYLQNYIVLQRLRTQGSPDILIEVNINETNCEHEIAPMLLIPFVENAFKYGVSQRNRSRIAVSLSCTSDKIYFDVYNTIHLNRSSDIEDSMGIGLNNVRQRLALLYPDRHELSIRETGTEFFVHLTIQIV